MLSIFAKNSSLFVCPRCGGVSTGKIGSFYGNSLIKHKKTVIRSYY